MPRYGRTRGFRMPVSLMIGREEDSRKNNVQSYLVKPPVFKLPSSLTARNFVCPDFRNAFLHLFSPFRPRSPTAGSNITVHDNKSSFVHHSVILVIDIQR